MKRALILCLSLGLIAALAVVIALWEREKPARATSPVTVAVDMIPDSAPANSCPHDGTNCTVGSIDSCVAVSPGSTFDVDIVVTGLSNGFSGFNFGLDFSDSELTLVASTHDSPTVNLMQQMPGSEPFDLSEAPPDTTSPYEASVADFGTFEPTPPYTQGVLGRYRFEVRADATPGSYAMGIAPGTLTVTDVLAATYPIEATLGGFVAIGQTCPASTATPSPTATPVLPTSPTPQPTPEVATTQLVSGWNDACYRGQAQPIEAAFDGIGGIQAVYRMNPDQTFDRWFPTRPDVSTITTLDPFDQLFVLSTSSALWMIQPTAQPPTSLLLNPGWNSLCYLGEGMDVADATSTISSAFSVMYSLAPDQSWRRFLPGRPELTTLDRLEPFTSVLILITSPEAGAWTFSS